MKKLLLLAFVIIVSVPILSQTQTADTIKYVFWIDDSQSQYEAFSGSMTEGEHFTIQPLTLPPAFARFQPLYDALVGGEMGFDDGCVNGNILINVTLGGLNSNNQLEVENQFLFMYMQVDVMDLATGTWYPPEESFYFNSGKGAYLKIPITPAFLAFCEQNGIDFSEGFSFAYLLLNPDGSQIWNSSGLSWELDVTTTPWTIILRLSHFSRFGGGGKTLAPTQTAINNDLPLPQQFNLLQNYPNPFNPSTVIKFRLPANGNVLLKIYNSLGKEISTVESGYKTAGEHSVEFNSGNLSSGTYFYTISFNGKVQTRKMLLIK